LGFQCMEQHNVTQTAQGTLHIEGLPDAVKLIRLNEPTAQEDPVLGGRQPAEYALRLTDQKVIAMPGKL